VTLAPVSLIPAVFGTVAPTPTPTPTPTPAPDPAALQRRIDELTAANAKLAADVATLTAHWNAAKVQLTNRDARIDATAAALVRVADAVAEAQRVLWS
jgi:uncharacterized protein YaiL (DUF2058 family)